MKFGINEVFKNLKVAFDAKKVSIVFAGTLIVVLISIFSAWVSAMAGNAIVCVALQIVSVFILLAVIACTAAAVSYMSYKELTMGKKLLIKDALVFSKDNIKILLLSPVTVGIVVFMFFFAEYLVFLLAKVPALRIAISIFTIPVVLFNTILIFVYIISLLLVSAIIAVDASDPVSNTKKIYSLTKNAPLQVLCSIMLSIIVAAPIFISLLLFIFGANIITVALFGSASGIFAAMAAMDVPILANSAQITWAIFAVFTLAFSLYAFSYILVFINTCSVNIYLSLKEKIK